MMYCPGRWSKLLIYPIHAFVWASTFLFAQTPTTFDCGKILAKFDLSPLDSLSSRERDFVHQALLPLVGPLLLVHETGSPRQFQKTALGFRIKFENDPDILIEWNSSQTNPHIEVSDTEHKLTLPRGELASDINLRAVLQNLLIGHSLNPYFAPRPVREQRKVWDQPPLVFRPVQKEAIDLVIDMDKSKAKKLLIVGPTAVGKSSILLEPLLEALKDKSSGLHMVVGDQESIMRQSIDYLDMMKADQDFEVIQWGAGVTAGSLKDLAQRVKSQNKPIVLVTSIQSFRARFEEANPTEVAQLRDVMKSIRWDESHHAGAPLAQKIIDAFVNAPNSQVLLRGVTSTPIHRGTQVPRIFDNKAFYLYLDNAQQFKRHPRSGERPIKDILRQFEIATSLGDISPVNQFFFLDPNDYTTERHPFWIPVAEEGVQRFIINPQIYPKYLKDLRPILLEHKSSFYTANTVTEADAMAQALSIAVPEIKVAAYHSESPNRQQIWNDYVNGKINCLVSVHMLDEAVDHHAISLWINGSRGLNPRMLIQRAGRTARHSARSSLGVPQPKYESAIVSIAEVSTEDLKDALELIGSAAGGFHSGMKSQSPRQSKRPHDTLTINRQALKRISQLDPMRGLERLTANLKQGYLQSQEQIRLMKFKGERLRLRENVLTALRKIHTGNPSYVGPLSASLRDLLRFNHQKELEEYPFLEDIVEEFVSKGINELSTTNSPYFSQRISDMESDLAATIRSALQNNPEDVDVYRIEREAPMTETAKVLAIQEELDDTAATVKPLFKKLSYKGRDALAEWMGIGMDSDGRFSYLPKHLKINRDEAAGSRTVIFRFRNSLKEAQNKGEVLANRIARFPEAELKNLPADSQLRNQLWETYRRTRAQTAWWHLGGNHNLFWSTDPKLGDLFSFMVDHAYYVTSPLDSLKISRKVAFQMIHELESLTQNILHRTDQLSDDIDVLNKLVSSKTFAYPFFHLRRLEDMGGALLPSEALVARSLLKSRPVKNFEGSPRLALFLIQKHEHSDWTTKLAAYERVCQIIANENFMTIDQVKKNLWSLSEKIY